MKAKDILRDMKPYKPGKGIEEVKKEYGLERIVKLASNENPFGFSPKVKQELPELITNLEIYPDGYAA
ncbi:MAG: histidinol-phosphate transaminase, partial [Halobacillus sp.]